MSCILNILPGSSVKPVTQHGPPLIEIHEEELRALISKPALNQPLQSKQAGGGTLLLRLARTSDTDRERKEETWILAYLKFAGATTSMLPRLGWLWGEAPEITARQHTSTQLCAGTGQVSSFLSPSVLRERSPPTPTVISCSRLDLSNCPCTPESLHLQLVMCHSWTSIGLPRFKRHIGFAVPSGRVADELELWWRLFGSRELEVPEDDISMQHICVYKERDALSLVHQLQENGGSNLKYTLLDPRESRITDRHAARGSFTEDF
ncbi:hypothetical protein J6590_080742 [Homalodisca vitripennis]|nr:hypothetical protein J6590_080742 [Homalodisca vitripennis]